MPSCHLILTTIITWWSTKKIISKKGRCSLRLSIAAGAGMKMTYRPLCKLRNWGEDSRCSAKSSVHLGYFLAAGGWKRGFLYPSVMQAMVLGIRREACPKQTHTRYRNWIGFRWLVLSHGDEAEISCKSHKNPHSKTPLLKSGHDGNVSAHFGKSSPESSNIHRLC